MLKTIRYAAAAALSLALSGAASAATLGLTVTVTSAGTNFSAPIFTYTNQSSAGVTISAVGLLGGPPWDFVYVGPVGSPYEILNPAGGTRTITQGEESATDPNNGCTANIGYALTSFDSGDSFRFSADPEAPGCGSAVIDIRSFLNSDQIGISGTFSDGTTLAGSHWTKELIDPNGNPNADTNQLYRLTLQATAAVPEPAAWGTMLLGLGLAGFVARRRRATASATV